MKTLLLIPVVLALAACGGGDSGCEVTYEVEGMNTQQRVTMTIALPGSNPPAQGTFQVWPNAHRETYQFNEGDFLYISGQNANSWNAAFKVRIYSNGKLVDENDGFGWSVAQAQGTCR